MYLCRECYIKITNFLRNCKPIFLSKYLCSATWRGFARFGNRKNAISDENSNIWSAKISQSRGCRLEMSGFFRIFKVSIRTAKAHFYSTHTWVYQGVHMNTARCLFSYWKGFEGPITSKRPCRVGHTPKSCPPFPKLRCHRSHGCETVETVFQWH